MQTTCCLTALVRAPAASSGDGRNEAKKVCEVANPFTFH